MISIWLQKLMGTLAAVCVLLSGVNCFCGTLMRSGGQDDRAGSCCCCSPSDRFSDKNGAPDAARDPQKNPKPGKQQEQCPHCQGAMNIDRDHSQASNLRPSFAFGLQCMGVLGSTINRFELPTIFGWNEHHRSPPIASPTLLRLHCALTI